MEPVLTTNPRTPLRANSPDSSTPVPIFGGEVTSPPPSDSTDSPAAENLPSPPNLWLRRISLALFALLFSSLGMLLVLLPWTLQWTDNPLLWTHPDLRTFLGYGFVRGICSGLGLLDLWIGIREVSHLFEHSGHAK